VAAHGGKPASLPGKNKSHRGYALDLGTDEKGDEEFERY
jgi:hypothetical protein